MKNNKIKYPVHKCIYKKLKVFIKNNKIPNILFHGLSGSGKKTILDKFIEDIYENVENKHKYIMKVNCAHGKGIRFIRDELKFFAKTNLNYKTNVKFKSIILLNADKLTIDAQSALRRCIELFSNTTRFFIVIEDRSKLLKPIISRFCNIYIPNHLINNNIVNLHKLRYMKISSVIHNKKSKLIKNTLDYITENKDKNDLYKYMLDTSIELYNKGISGYDIIKYIEKNHQENLVKYKLLLYFDKIRYNYRNEKLLITHILSIYTKKDTIELETICNM
jgi:DNA polymerase III delta prime subunit